MNYMNSKFNQSDETVTVFMGGFPKTTDVVLIEQYLATICSDNECVAITDQNNKSRGFAFVTFNTIEEANEFVKKKFAYNGKTLDIRLSLDSKDFISSSLLNIREPRKLFVDKIPNNLKKDDLLKIFKKFGEIEEIILFEKNERLINFAYVTFFKHMNARKCVEKKTFDANSEKNVYTNKHSEKKMTAIYARPKFTKKMLSGLHPMIVEYIVNVQEGNSHYHPKDFIYLQDVV